MDEYEYMVLRVYAGAFLFGFLFTCATVGVIGYLIWRCLP